MSKAHNRWRALKRLEQSHSHLMYSHEPLTTQIGSELFRYKAESLGPWWLRVLMGDEYCMRVRGLLLTLADDDLMGELRHLREIEILMIHPGPRFTDDGLRQVGNLTELKLLDVAHGRRISTAGFACLGRLKQLRELRLESLAVNNNVLSHIEELPQLQRLSIRQTFVTRDAVEQFGQEFPNIEIDFQPRVQSPSLFP